MPGGNKAKAKRDYDKRGQKVYGIYILNYSHRQRHIKCECLKKLLFQYLSFVLQFKEGLKPFSVQIPHRGGLNFNPMNSWLRRWWKNKYTVTEIRNLAKNDYDAMIQLWLRADLPIRIKGRDSKSAIESQMRSSPDFFIGAFEKSGLVGIVVVSSDGRKGWLNRLAVNPDYRR